MSLILLLLLQGSALEEYRERSSDVSQDDPKAQYELGLWCKKKGLSSESKSHFELSVFADPTFVPSRKELSHKKIGRDWVSPEILKAVERGIHFPPQEQVRRLRKRGREVSQILDLFWDRKNWAVALSRIHYRTGLYTGTLNIQIQFRLLAVPAMGGGYGGEGTIKLDIDKLVAYGKVIDQFARKVVAGGRVQVPPARMNSIITHELTHCFQGDAAPQWFLEGMAAYVAGDGHFVHFFRHQNIPVSTIETRVDRRHVYARGWGFFAYVHETWGPSTFRKMISEILVEGTPASVALEKLSGIGWEPFQEKERIWTEQWIKTYR